MLLTIFLFLFQAVSNRTPNNANVADPVESYDTWGLPWWGVVLIFVVVGVIAVFVVKKLGWHLPGKGKGTGSGNVFKS